MLPVCDHNENKIGDIEFHVIDNLRHPCIIGNPVITMARMTPFKKNRATLRFGPGQSNAVVRVRIHKTKSLNDNNETTFPVYTAQTVSVPAGSAVLLVAEVKFSSSHNTLPVGAEVDYIPMTQPPGTRRPHYF